MEKNEIYIGLEPARFVEKLDYEIRILTNITSFLINRGYDTNSEIFQYYYRTLEARRIQWDEARRILGEEVPVEGRNQEWWLDYQTGILHYDTPKTHDVSDIKETKSNSQTRKLRYGRPEQFTDQMARIYNNAGKSVRSISFQLTDDCSLRCSYCVEGNSQITLADGKQKFIKDLERGDTVLGFYEKSKDKTLRPAEILNTFHHKAKVVHISTLNGRELTITPNHKVLCTRKGSEEDFIEAGKLKVGDSIYSTLSGELAKTKITSITDCGDEEIDVYNIETTTGTYIANGIAVHNCYQINKGHHRMPFDVAKRFIDILLANKNPYINLDNTAGIIMDFIGGEPLMEPELIDQIATYFFERMITEKHPWLFQTRMSMSSNGTLYFKEEVNKVLQKWQGWLSFNVSIDGNKELHDACRVFPDGSGSYDIAMAAVKDWISKGYYMGSKMTLAPANIKYTFDAVKGLIESGYDEINLNCVFEKGWTDEDATTLYYQLKKLADYLIDNDLYKDHFLSIFSESIGNSLSPEENGNWCWAKGTPVLTVNGYKPIEEIKIGDLVYTERGTVRAVTNTIHHKAENCVEIKPDGFPTMVCTSDHKLFARHVHGEDYGKIDIASIYNQGLEIATNLTNETDGSRIFVKLDSYKKVSPREVYNITVAEEHSYIAGNLMSANCGGTGSMIAVDYKGDIYPCIRYMESSLGDKVKPLIIGNVYDGIMSKQCEKDCVKCLEAITRRSQSTDECFYCPIAQGCAWCFPAGTKILTPSGYKNIEDIKVGDIVIDGTGVSQKVEANFERIADNIVSIKAKNFPDTYTTEEHPFMTYNVERGVEEWKAAKDIKKGDLIAIVDEDAITHHYTEVIDSELPHLDKLAVYNLTVANTHTYIANGAVVHNCSGYNYQEFGTANKRATYICEMHKARVLANVYYWNKVYKLQNNSERYKNNVPNEWALKIIPQDEIDMLNDLAKN